MKDLEKRISGEWFDIRESATDQYTLSAYLKMSASRLTGVAAYLRMCVEEGLLEYKGSILRPLFVLLEETRYQNLSPEQLSLHEEPLQNLVAVTLLQRMICTGAIELPRESGEEPDKTPQLDVNAVIADIKERIKKDPEFKNNPLVKNILMQVSIYQKERVKMQELQPMIRDEKRETFRQNYGNIFARIFDSIRKNYENILQQEEERRLDEKTNKELMHLLNLKNLSPLLSEQAQMIARAGSTLSFAAEDKYKTREFLVALYQEKKEFLELISKEETAYVKICKELGINDEACAHKISSRFRDLLIRVLEKMSQVEE